MKLPIELAVAVSIKFLLEYAYISFVNPVFGYAGFTYDFILSKYLLGWAIYVTGFLLLCSKRHLHIFELYLLLFLLFVLPNIVFFCFSDQQISDLFIVLGPYFTILLLTNNWKGHPVSVAGGKLIILAVSLVAVLSVILHFFVATGGEMVLNFTDEYAFRERFDARSTAGIFGYLNNWVAYVFVVLILSWSLDKKKLFLTAVSIASILLLFAFSGHKGVLQSIFLVFFFYCVFQFKNRSLLILSGFLGLILSVVVVTNLTSNMLIGSLIVRRLLFVPAHLNSVYLEFFSQNEFVYWSNGIMSSFLDYPYHVRTVELIGQYLGYENLAANAGFIATGFMHAGYVGVILYTVIAAIIFNIINALARNNHKYFVLSLTFIPISILFRSSDLLTSILTHGLLVSILALWLYSNKEYVLKAGNLRLYRI